MKRLLFFTVLCTGIAMFLAGPVCAAVTGECVNCHTMHNSQDGAHMMINTTIDGEEGGTHGGGYPSLTRGSCVGCHSGTVTAGPIPVVNTLGSEPTDYLAGGNFWWVAQGAGSNAKGHNVKAVPGIVADTLTKAPGGFSCANSCHDTLFAPNGYMSDDPLNTGCEGCHLAPKHHAPAQDANDPALAANGYFRFLSGQHGGGEGHGVEGIEDSDWQFVTTAGNHNEYLGKVGGTHEGGGGFSAITGNTMTAYCTGCHGNFHIQRDGSAASANWIRHPSDAVLPTDGEYAAYIAYDPIAPVARPILASIADKSVVVPGTDMVMCLSCHRAHGSPYDDMLRWEYSGMVAGGGDTGGCFVCHTEKD